MANNQVFISWSGERSRDIALIWKSLIEDTFDSVNAFVSHRDISPGARGLTTIKAQLDGTSVGIPIVTRDNVGAPWINFESGALSKEVPNAPAMVMPCLVDYKDPSELTGPLTQFQAKLLNQDGVEEILSTISRANAIEWQRKKAGFEARWPEFERQFNLYKTSPEDKEEARRSIDDMLAEIVNNTRVLRKALAASSTGSASGISGGFASQSEVDSMLAALSAAQFDLLQIVSRMRAEVRAEVTVSVSGNLVLLVWRWPKDEGDALRRLAKVHGLSVYRALPMWAQRRKISTENAGEILLDEHGE